MLCSMTGFGKSACQIQGVQIEIQLASLNSKGLDISCKMPDFLKEKEAGIRTMISEELNRGKIDFSMTIEKQTSEPQYTFNQLLAEKYLMSIKEMEQKFNLSETENYMSVITHLPDVIQKTNQKSFTENDWAAATESIRIAIGNLHEYRKSEGENLHRDISGRIDKIASLLNSVENFSEKRKETIREKLLSELEKHFQQLTIDKGRFEQEVLYYIERIDISEEIVRAVYHCRYFKETMDEDNSVGKKLLFISQELLRELNTMGVKSGDTDIQKLTVEMKDELEKIREQLNNVL